MLQVESFPNEFREGVQNVVEIIQDIKVEGNQFDATALYNEA